MCAAFLAAMLMLLTLAVAGCEDLGGGVTEPSSSATSVTDDTSSTESTGDSAVTTSTAAATTSTTLASTEEVLPSGHITSMGFIDDVWVSGGKRWLSIDYAEFVYGEDATDAARADGEIGPTEEWDLDFYIRNQSARLRTWEISDSAVITTSTRVPPNDGLEVPCTWSEFLSFWGPGLLDDIHLHEAPWWIERDGDTVVTIYEQYLP